MTILADIRAQLAQQTRIVEPPTGALGYGIDLSCVDDLDENMREVDPESPEGIMQSVIRFLTTDRDSIPDAPGRGWNLRRLLNRAYTAAALEAQEGLAAQEVEQDDRIASSSVTLTVNLALRSVKARVRIVPRAPGLVPFDFITTVTDGETLAELLRA